MSRREAPSRLAPVAIFLLAGLLLTGCEFASPDNPESTVVLKQGVDPMLFIVLLVAAFAGGWYAHKKIRGGELRDRHTDGYNAADNESPY